jgi:signal transduction protein with GAF and PtsI domain
MPASGIGPVKRLILSMDVNATERALARLMSRNRPSIRYELTEFATSEGYAL